MLDRLDVHEFANPELTQLAPVTRSLYTPEGQSRLRRHHAIQENHSGVDIANESLALDRVVSPRTRAKPVPGAVGEIYCLIDG